MRDPYIYIYIYILFTVAEKNHSDGPRLISKIEKAKATHIILTPEGDADFQSRSRAKDLNEGAPKCQHD